MQIYYWSRRSYARKCFKNVDPVTFLLLYRDMIEDPNVTFVGYRVPHPLNTNIEIRVLLVDNTIMCRFRLLDHHVLLAKQLQIVAHALWSFVKLYPMISKFLAFFSFFIPSCMNRRSLKSMKIMYSWVFVMIIAAV